MINLLLNFKENKHVGDIDGEIFFLVERCEDIRNLIAITAVSLVHTLQHAINDEIKLTVIHENGFEKTGILNHGPLVCNLLTPIGDSDIARITGIGIQLLFYLMKEEKLEEDTDENSTKLQAN